MIYVTTMNGAVPDTAVAVNTTSRSTNWSRGLSPFFVGPCKLYNDYEAKNVENAWQFCKVYKEHLDAAGNPSDKYFEWAKKGWQDTFAHRYPMGRGAIPEYSWWDGKKLSYIEARKQIYIPLYANTVKNTEAFAELKELSQSNVDMWLQDFDGFNFRKLNMSYDDVINCESRKMSHAFVLAMLLDGFII